MRTGRRVSRPSSINGRITRTRECLRHEEFDHFSIGEVGVTVKVDFIGKMPDGTLVLTDRETGRDDDEYETEPRMAAYVLWAKEFYRMNTDAISTELVFLKTGATKPYAFFEEQLRGAGIDPPGICGDECFV